MNSPLANAFLTSWLANVLQLLRFSGGSDDEIDREITAARQRRRRQRDRADSGNLRKRSRRFDQELLRRFGALAPRFGHHSAKAAVGNISWKILADSGNDR